jgi:hypothetical protein
MPTRRHRSVRFLQGLGCACRIVMVLTHVAERLHLLPGMGVACWRIRVGFCRPGARKKNPAGAGLSDSRSPACRRHEAEVHETIGSQPLRIR